MTESEIFREAIEAIKKEKPAQARELLTRLLRSDKENPDTWLWLSSVVESRKEQIYCLQTALRLDPVNHAALRGLKTIGAGPADREIVPIPPVRRAWDVEIPDDEASLQGFAKIWANTVWRIMIVAGAGIVVVIFLLSAIFGRNGSIFSPRLTVTPLVWTSTPTQTSTNTPLVRTPTSTPSVVEPLWMLLEATYTPRPVHVNTPHARIEAYRIGIRAYADGDYESVLNFMEQVVRDNPGSADVHYYVGEAHRLLGDYEQALAAFERAISLDANFAPVYVGRALAHLLEDEDANIEDDLARAIALDTQFEASYFALATYWLARGEPETALEILIDQEELLGENPQFYFLQAQALFELGQHESALAQALEAYQRDITALPIYSLLAQIYFENDQVEEGLPYLETYGLYKKDDPLYWALLGRAYYERGDDYDSVTAALEQALALDDELAVAYQIRGLAALDAGDGKQALNDLYLARNLDPQSFSISLGFGLAFWAEERYDEASAQMRASADLAKSDVDLGKAYYYVAKLATEIGPVSRAKQYWNYLLDLPEGAVPEAWLLEAELYFNPLTATATPTATVTPSLTPTP